MNPTPAHATGETIKQIHYLAAALKAPRITAAAIRLADQARDEGWTHENYLAAVMEREVSARNASGAELRIRAAGFPARKTWRTSTLACRAPLETRSLPWPAADSSPKPATWSCSAHPAPAKPTSRPAWVSPRPATDTESCSLPPPNGSPDCPTPTASGSYPRN